VNSALIRSYFANCGSARIDGIRLLTIGDTLINLMKKLWILAGTDFLVPAEICIWNKKINKKEEKK